MAIIGPEPNHHQWAEVDATPPGEITEGLRDWIRGNSIDILAALDFLSHNPDLFDLILACARTMTQGRDFAFTPGNESGRVEHEARRQRIRRWLQSGDFGACGSCYAPILFFGTSISLDWPDVYRHSCTPGRARTVSASAGNRPRTVAV